MMNQESVIEYFGRLAANWDVNTVRNDEIIGMILDHTGVCPGKDILDVACGTGVLIPDYLQRRVASVTAIDLTPELAKIAARKFPQENVQVLCGDVENTDFGKQFDCVVVYNAFPHFPDPKRLVRHLSSLLKPGGSLTVAHGFSRDRINSMHSEDSSEYSNGLMSAEDLSAIFGKYLNVTTVISDERMYQVVGRND